MKLLEPLLVSLSMVLGQSSDSKFLYHNFRAALGSFILILLLNLFNYQHMVKVFNQNNFSFKNKITIVLMDKNHFIDKYITIFLNQEKMSIACKECQKLKKKINVITADYEFELKKIQEDKSTEKALYEIHLQKEIRKWQQSFTQEKNARQQENYQWITKHDEIIKKNQAQVLRITLEAQSLLSKTIEKLTSEASQKYTTMVSSYEKRIEDLIQSSELDKKLTEQRHTDIVKTMINSHQEDVKKIKKYYLNIIDDKIKHYESILLGKQSQKKTEISLHQKTKQQGKQAKAKLYEQIFVYKKKVIEIEAHVQTLKQVIQEKKNQISVNLKQLSDLKVRQEKETKKLSEEYEKKIQATEKKSKERIRQIYQKTLLECNQYKQSLKCIEQTRESEKELYIDNIENIQQTVQNRPSRSQDLEQIEYLKQVLSKKVKECECMNEELKWYRLELQNKEETYNRIFVPISGVSNNENNNNVVCKRKEFKLRRAGRSVTTVREILQNTNNNATIGDRKLPPSLKSKIL